MVWGQGGLESSGIWQRFINKLNLTANPSIRLCSLSQGLSSEMHGSLPLV